MAKFWNRWRPSRLERELKASCPQAREEFVHSLAQRVRDGSPQLGFGRLRIVLVAALTSALLVALAAFGGYDYALAGGKGFAKAVGSVASSNPDNGRGGNNNNDDDDEGEDDDDDAADDEHKHRKITICHRMGSSQNPTVTIRIRRSAWPAHEAHGDTMGRCDDE